MRRRELEVDVETIRNPALYEVWQVSRAVMIALAIGSRKFVLCEPPEGEEAGA